MTDPPNREVAIFTEALRLPAEKRAACLDAECAGDAALRRRVEAFLLAHDEAGVFLEGPAEGAERGQSCPQQGASPQYAKSTLGAASEGDADRNSDKSRAGVR